MATPISWPFVDPPVPPRSKGDLIRDAFRRRAGQAVEQIATSASLPALAQALSAPTNYGVVASALGNATMPEAAIDLDPLADALARGVAGRDRLAVLAGPLLSASALGRALGISRQSIDKRRRAHQLLAVRAAGDWHYPAAQIGGDGQVPPLLPAILAEGNAIGISGWAMLDFLFAPDEALSGATPLEALRRTGGDAADVRRLLEAAKADAFG